MTRSLSDETAPFTRAELEAMTKPTLLDIARQRGAEGLGNRSLKADIIDTILGAAQ